jgi:hypothetical protein
METVFECSRTAQISLLFRFLDRQITPDLLWLYIHHATHDGPYFSRSFPGLLPQRLKRSPVPVSAADCLGALGARGARPRLRAGNGTRRHGGTVAVMGACVAAARKSANQKECRDSRAVCRTLRSKDSRTIVLLESSGGRGVMEVPIC